MNNIQKDFKVAAVQMVSSTRLDDNLEQAAGLIAQAAESGAQLVALPEYFCIMGRKDTDKLAIKEAEGAGPIQAFLADQARKHGIWLVGGSLPLHTDEAQRIFNTTLVYDPAGRQVARYDKVHLFSFRKGDEAYDESIVIKPGTNSPQVFTTPFGRVGLSICYDLRFPEFFRAMGPVDLIVLPSAFTYTTGSAHWEILLRARAIENQCYVLAPAQGGKHENGRRTWGHSVLIDPWGEIIAQVDQDAGVALGEISPDRMTKVRASLPALQHRTM